MNSFIGTYTIPDITICDRIIDHFEHHSSVQPGGFMLGQQYVIDPARKSCDQVFLISITNCVNTMSNSYNQRPISIYNSIPGATTTIHGWCESQFKYSVIVLDKPITIITLSARVPVAIKQPDI